MKLDLRKLEIIRAKSGKTTEQLAKRYGCSISRLNALLHQESVRPLTANRLAQTFQVDLTEIIAD